MERLRLLEEKVESNLWGLLVELHLVDDMIDVILREKVRWSYVANARPMGPLDSLRTHAHLRGCAQFYFLGTLVNMTYSDQIKYGVPPQNIRAMNAHLKAAAAEQARPRSDDEVMFMRGRAGAYARPKDDL